MGSPAISKLISEVLAFPPWIKKIKETMYLSWVPPYLFSFLLPYLSQAIKKNVQRFWSWWTLFVSLITSCILSAAWRERQRKETVILQTGEGWHFISVRRVRENFPCHKYYNHIFKIKITWKSTNPRRIVEWIDLPSR